MGRSKKRQKTAHRNEDIDIGNDEDKDDEERRLESILFGTKYVPHKDVIDLSEEEKEYDEPEGREMGKENRARRR